jgi:hypothetical protein
MIPIKISYEYDYVSHVPDSVHCVWNEMVWEKKKNSEKRRARYVRDII